jgi:HPt (histidine-containing phosphotransfer) domain-containing protein
MASEHTTDGVVHPLINQLANELTSLAETVHRLSDRSDLLHSEALEQRCGMLQSALKRIGELRDVIDTQVS